MPSSTQTNQMLETLINFYLSKEAVLIKNLPFVLDAIVNHGLFSESSELSEESAGLRKKWTVRLNSLLQSKVSTVRWCGITLVRATCESSHSLLVANAKTWCAQLLAFIAKNEADMIHKETLETLQFIFTYTHDKPELHREVATPNMQRFNQLLLQLAQKEILLPSVLSALAANNAHFPSNSKHIAEQTLQLCLSCLDGSRDLDEKTVLEANKCMASLYRTGGKSVMADLWRDHLLRLVGSVHQCLNRLFDTVDEETIDTELPSGYPFLSVDRDYIEAFPVLMKRIELVQGCISTFLTSSTCVPVRIPVVQLVDLVCRIYNVFEGSLMRDYKDKGEFVSLMMCLPTLHYSTSKMLSSLLYCTGQEMLRYKDLQTVERKSASLVVPNQSKGSHKKRKTDLTNSDSISSKLVSASAPDVQMAALQALASFLSIFGFALENAQRASIDSVILARLLQFVPPSDLTDEEVNLVKIELYNCLLASVTHPIETQASILPHASRLFTAGMNQSVHGLQAICRKGLSVCDLITHARLPPVQRALPKESPVVHMSALTTHVEQKPAERSEPAVIGTKRPLDHTEKKVPEQQPLPEKVQHELEKTAGREKTEVTVEKQNRIEPSDVNESLMNKTRDQEEQPESVLVIEKEQRVEEIERSFQEALANQITTNKVELTQSKDASEIRIESRIEQETIEEDISGFDIPDIDMAGPDSDVEDE
ncbi:hypothetical protein G6F57_001104 [Rhizopus arrhizus]|uniref:Pre-rRNA-processing protein RIX1 n=1 Tax=Rhizopus oryzae TaxID=64495 RepID=A0A9P6XII7_RHIOR|nr:hypothetical protein G6F23_005381 [Rhizopus arrhizus]KAG1420482.1 hypothetical protein G6F58_004170 [Rhizopus delemar]KAG0767983.1 hypothetical protein G6F24_002329 [Rhizopus arrhizus]KAG0792054.1 hypothetical protein G6F21_004635 [Rhizopus arrhizus]KAG0795713.1 hypothetical protein G6F22_005056 [Rhizopus arrhizus]